MNVLEKKSAIPWRAWLAAIAASILLVACGGGGSGSTNAGTCTLGCTPEVVVPPTAADMTLSLSATSVPNSTTSSVEVTITAVDANRATVAKIPVTLAVDAGATIKQSAAVTDSAGQLKGVVSIGGDMTPRKITVTAVSGTLKKTATIDVTGTTVAADLILVVTPTVLHNTGAAAVVATATAVDANRATLTGVPITLRVDNGAIVKVGNSVSDSNGQVTGAISIGEDKTNRTIVVTAASGGLTRTTTIQVDGTKIKSTLLGAVLSPGESGVVQYSVTDFSSNPMPKVNLAVTGPSGVQSVITTNQAGEATYSFQAPSQGGSYDIRAAAPGVENSVSVLVNTGATVIGPASGIVRSPSVSASPSVVAVNSSATQNKAVVRALFIGDNNAPIKNVRVRFDLAGNPQSVPGSFSTGIAQVYSDDSGAAYSSYVPGARFSPTDGVTIRACWDYNDFPAGTCPNAVTTTLTVAADALSVTIGTNGLIGTGDSGLTYVKRYVVQVVDSAGYAVKDVQVSAQVDLLDYRKGYWEVNALLDRWNLHQFPTGDYAAICPNEDVNRNGISETFADGSKEDANNSFNQPLGRPALDPRRADVAVSVEGSNVTNASGIVVVRVEYPMNIAGWVSFNLVVGATGVAGTEGRADFLSLLPIPANAITNKDVPPPFAISPYGVQTSPRTPVTIPGTATVVQLCTNPN